MLIPVPPWLGERQCCQGTFKDGGPGEESQRLTGGEGGEGCRPGHAPCLPSNPSASPSAVILNSFFLHPVPPASDSPCASCIYLSDSFLITCHQAFPPTFPWCTPHQSPSSGLQFHLLATLEPCPMLEVGWSLLVFYSFPV